MCSISRLGLLGLALVVTAPLAQDANEPSESMTVGRKIDQKQPNLDCPVGWDAFCGGWTIDIFTFKGGDPKEHPGKDDGFVIGQRGGNMYVYFRDRSGPLKGRRTVLIPIEADGTKCLYAQVDLDHPSQGSIVTHVIQFLSITGSSHPDFGSEATLDLTLADIDGVAWPPESCKAISDKHAGVGHAED